MNNVSYTNVRRWGHYNVKVIRINKYELNEKCRGGDCITALRALLKGSNRQNTIPISVSIKHSSDDITRACVHVYKHV